MEPLDLHDGVGKVLLSPPKVGERLLFEEELWSGATAQGKQFQDHGSTYEEKVRRNPTE
jgi:hypothetical protein